MNTNFFKQFEMQMAAAQGTPSLLLHVCCAPCATHCLTQLLEKFDITLFFSNDNITDFGEWQKRLGEVRKLMDIVNSGNFEVTPSRQLKLQVQPFDNRRFFDVAKGLELQKEGGERCTQCFALRLQDTAAFADKGNFEYFATTLTVSPYKNAQLINQIGLSLHANAKWLCTDFKKQNGYNNSVRLSQKYGLYRQHYCGCVFSNRQPNSQN